jgi:GT2 family glycosyltransferase
VVIVNWNSREFLRACLTSLLAHTTVDLEVVVIDSGSFDGCDAMLREHYPRVRFIQSRENLGFAKANNRAFAESTGECILFLNPDTELIGPAVDRLFAALSASDARGAVGGKLLNSDGSIQSSSIQATPTLLNKLLDLDVLKQRWPQRKLWGMAPLYEKQPQTRIVEAISGACLMVKRDVFESVGKFSEDYFMYAEDVDLAYKIRMAGYENVYVPDATLTHHGGSSSSGSGSTFAAVMMPEATWRFLRKTRGDRYAGWFRAVIAVSAIGRLAALGAVVPLCVRGSFRQSWQARGRKWLAVLRWALKRDELVKKYYGSAVPTAVS